jgi:hypothetical protein
VHGSASGPPAQQGLDWHGILPNVAVSAQFFKSRSLLVTYVRPRFISPTQTGGRLMGIYICFQPNGVCVFAKLFNVINAADKSKLLQSLVLSSKIVVRAIQVVNLTNSKYPIKYLSKKRIRRMFSLCATYTQAGKLC